ncbi:MAG: hypothetical protein R3213_08765, partial [Flavobacteriaceae bacterium]|nr:hypothetical protein [Flavobacteriaceae bacterium]
MKLCIPFSLNIKTASFALLLFFHFLFVLSQEQIGRPPIINYSYEDYGGAPINWWILEGDNGIMYFANTQGVLEFDGVTWNLIRIGSNQGIRCLAKNSEGTIFLGSGNDFGYLEINEKGEYNYQSLKDKVPEEHRTFAEVWEVDYFEG